jgi:hypothetical protein
LFSNKLSDTREELNFSGDHAAECIGKSIRGNNSIQTIVIVNNGFEENDAK